MRRVIFASMSVMGSFCSANVQADRLIKVQEISFIGHEWFTEDELRKQIRTQAGDQFDTDRSATVFEHDMQKLNYAYFKDGFVTVRISPPQILAATNKKTARLVFSITEGPRFRLGQVEFSGDWPKSPEELRRTIKLSKHLFFNYEVLQADLKKLEQISGANHYPLPRTRIREADREVDVTFELAKAR